jgi:hypothetical protein
VEHRGPIDRAAGAPEPNAVQVSRRVVQLLRQRRFLEAEQLCEAISRGEAAAFRGLGAIDDGPRSLRRDLLGLAYVLALTAGVLAVVDRAQPEKPRVPERRRPNPEVVAGGQRLLAPPSARSAQPLSAPGAP